MGSFTFAICCTTSTCPSLSMKVPAIGSPSASATVARIGTCNTQVHGLGVGLRVERRRKRARADAIACREGDDESVARDGEDTGRTKASCMAVWEGAVTGTCAQTREKRDVCEEGDATVRREGGDTRNVRASKESPLTSDRIVKESLMLAPATGADISTHTTTLIPAATCRVVLSDCHYVTMNDTHTCHDTEHRAHSTQTGTRIESRVLHVHTQV
jgi:hypothetical protein